jgi:integrase
VKFGILDPERAAGSKSLSDHIADFKAFLVAKGSTIRHCKSTCASLGRIFTACKFIVFTDITAIRIMYYLGGLTTGQRTYNSYLKALKQFCKWMVLHRRASENPVEMLTCKQQTEKRRERRALTVDEVTRLIATTKAGPDRFGVTGWYRAIVYIFAIETGLRACEIRCLQVRDFDFTNNIVTIPASAAKNKKAASVPIKEETASALKQLLSTKMPTVKALYLPYTAINMLRPDLEAAKIDYQDAAGRYIDFHSLRHTTGTLLAAAGVHPKVAQSILRHSDVNLTLNFYTHVLTGQEKTAIEALPTSILAKEKVKNGTADENVSASGSAFSASKVTQGNPPESTNRG